MSSRPKWTFRSDVVLALVYFALASLTLATTRLGGGVAILFVANAVVTARLLSVPRPLWRRTLASCGIASAAATALFGFGPMAAPVLSVINMAEVFAGAWLFRRLSKEPPLESMRGFFAFAFAAAVAAPALCSLFGAGVASLYGADYWSNVGRWFSGHALGALTFAPLALLVLRGDIRTWARSSPRALVTEAVLLLGAVTAVALATFGGFNYPLLFLPWLPVIVATFRLGRLGAAASIGILTAIAGGATLMGFGPIVAFVEGREAELRFLQFYLAVTVLAVLPAAAELARRKDLFERLKASEERYRLLADHSTDVILDIDLEGHIVFASAAVRAVAGYEPDGLIGRLASELVDPADVSALRAAHVRAVTTPGAVETIEYRAITASGAQVWMETRTQGVFDDAGRALGAVSVIRNVEERRARERALAKEARTDGLTGALNRRAFTREIDKAARSQRKAERGCLALFDLDHFKRINDTFGHAAGDEVLVAFVTLARSIVREEDLVARFGGEEFAILLRGASWGQAQLICERLRAACANRIHLPEGQVTVSAGIAELDGSAPETVIERADAALYRAKRAGRNRLELAA